MSLAGVMLGVGFYVLTQAQTGGYKDFFIETILGTSGAVRVTDRFQPPMTEMSVSAGPDRVTVRQRQGPQYEEGVSYPDFLREALMEFEQVEGVSEVLESQVNASSGFREQTAQIYGIRTGDHRRVSSIERQLVLGDLADFERDPQAVMISPRMAERLQVELGDTLQIQMGSESRGYRIAALIESGVSAIDRARVYVDLSEARSLMRKPFGGAMLQLAIQDPSQADLVARQIEDSLGHIAASWQERERVWLGVFGALSISAGISMSSIIVLAGLGIYNALSMQVVEKQREIAILRAMGYRRWDIMRVFLYQGAWVACIGVLGGWVLGGTLTWLVTQIPLRIRGIFSSDHFVVSWDGMDYLWGGLIACVIAMVGSILPAVNASRIEPGEVIRGN